MKQLYRVELVNPTSELRHSSHFRYGRQIQLEPYFHFYNTYVSVMQKVPHLPVDFLVSVNNQICHWGEVFLDQLNAAMDHDGNIDLYTVKQNPNYKGLRFPFEHINDFLQSFDEEHPFTLIDEQAFFWEYFLDVVRSFKFPDLPCRLDSTFFFTNEASCNYYINQHVGLLGKTYEVIIDQEEKYFEGDMKWIDNIQNDIPYIEMIETISKYWRGELTPEPVVEVVYQGTYRIKS